MAESIESSVVVKPFDGEATDGDGDDGLRLLLETHFVTADIDLPSDCCEYQGKNRQYEGSSDHHLADDSPARLWAADMLSIFDNLLPKTWTFIVKIFSLFSK